MNATCYLLVIRASFGVGAYCTLKLQYLPLWPMMCKCTYAQWLSYWPTHSGYYGHFILIMNLSEIDQLTRKVLFSHHTLFLYEYKRTHVIVYIHVWFKACEFSYKTSCLVWNYRLLSYLFISAGRKISHETTKEDN